MRTLFRKGVDAMVTSTVCAPDAFVRRLVRALVVTFVLRTHARFHDTCADALAAACRDLALDPDTVHAEALPFLHGDVSVPAG